METWIESRIVAKWSQAMNQGYVVIPLAGGIRWFVVVGPDGSIVSEHKTCAAALAKARRLNRRDNNA